MKFVHIADCHIDGFREVKLAKLGFENFTYSLDFAIEKSVDFILIAGDLFNTAIPRLDALKMTVAQLKRLQEKNIPVYVIPGSHDYSSHGNTMLDVLELAGLLENVMKGSISNESLELTFTKDPKTGTLITGILGKKGMLDKKFYEQLDTSKLVGDGFKIFMFHTAITELKTKKLEEMESNSISSLPEGFDYYAGGHVHIVKRFSNNKYKQVAYPGPTFPNSFSELEELKKGSFIFYDSEQVFSEDGHTSNFQHIFIPNKEVLSALFDAEGKSPFELEEEIKEFIDSNDCEDKIFLLRIFGQLRSGKSQDIQFKELIRQSYDNKAYIVLKNTYKLTSKEFEEVSIDQETSELVEEATVKEHLGQIEFTKDCSELETIKLLLEKLNCEIQDGEKKTVFTERIVELTKDILESK